MSKHIMVFDDDQTMRDMFTVLLEDAGYTVTIQHTPTVTVEEVEETAPDLILVDWMHGREQRGTRLIERLAAHRPTATIPVIACSIEASPRLVEENGSIAHNMKVIRKPFELDALMKIVAHQLAA